MPSNAAWVAMALMVGAMALDGVTEYMGMRSTTNELRLITGLLAGFAIGALVAPMINDELWRTSSRERVLDTPWKLAAWLAAVPLAYVLVYWGLPLLGVGYPILVAAFIVGTLTAVNLVMVCTLPPFERRAEQLSQSVGTGPRCDGRSHSLRYGWRDCFAAGWYCLSSALAGEMDERRASR